jgi:hypothetical protein
MLELRTRRPIGITSVVELVPAHLCMAGLSQGERVTPVCLRSNERRRALFLYKASSYLPVAR